MLSSTVIEHYFDSFELQNIPIYRSITVAAVIGTIRGLGETALPYDH